MGERYPDDATLLGLEEDGETGVEYIPTGKSPYFLEFRRLVQRLLLAGVRANDFRVYRDGDLSVGVRAGRCVIGGQTVVFGGETGLVVTNNATTSVWLDSAGVIASGTGGFPADRTGHLRLAEVTASAGLVTSIVDVRGEGFLLVADLSMLGVTASGAELSQALEGIGPTVDAAALNALTGGPTSDADGEHRHTQMVTDADAETEFRLVNSHAGSGANVLLRFDLPNRLPGVTDLMADPMNGFLRQRFGGVTRSLVVSVHAEFGHAGVLSGNQTGKLMGVVPVDGVVSDVVVSVGANLVTSVGTDGIEGRVSVNGTLVTSTHPKVTVSAGSGFRSTGQGAGVAAVVKSDGTEQVSKGDVLTVDVMRLVTGSVSVEASDVVVMVTVRASRPE